MDLNLIVLLKRLCNRRLYQAASKLAEYIGINKSYILTHWATKKICEKLEAMKSSIDFVDMAKTFFSINRSELALLLELLSVLTNDRDPK